MKYIVISDIHGSLDSVNMIKAIIDKECFDKIILLGDIYYNYSSYNEDRNEIADVLNKYSDKIICIRGNCDSFMDEEISNFKFYDDYKVIINGKKFLFSHGHLHDIYNLPDDVDVYVFGHLHKHFIKKIDNKIIVNSGSISFPKENTKHSFLIINDYDIIIMDVNCNNIDKVCYR